MKENIEKLIKRNDGKRVKIIAEIFGYGYGELEYRTRVLTCEKGKRSWFDTFDSNSYEYRKMSMDDRRDYERKSQFNFVSEDEILQAKTELWKTLNPANN